MSKEIELRTAQESDFSDFWEFCSNEEVSKYLTWDKYTDKDLAKSFFEEKMLKNTELPNVYLMILYQGKVIGNAHIIERPEDGLQIGIGLLPQYWHKKLGTHALVELENYIRKNWKSKYCQLLADIHENNTAMRKILLNQGYTLKSSIENHRQAYRKIITEENFDYVEWLKDNELIESVVGIGSLSEDKMADMDIIVICYEESSIDEVMHKTQYIESLKSYEKACCNHVFITFQDSRVYDTYFVSEAFINAVNNVNRVIFDKSGLVSKVLDVESKMDLDELVSVFINNTSKLIYKAKGGKLEQVTRILGDIRNKSIIPLGNYDKCLVSKNVINLNWIDKNTVLYETYMSTFAQPMYEPIAVAINKCLELLNYFIEKYELKKYIEKNNEINEYAKEFL